MSDAQLLEWRCRLFPRFRWCLDRLLPDSEPSSADASRPASLFRRVTTGPRAKALSRLPWSAQGLCLSGSSQSKMVYPSTCWRFLRGLPRSNGFSPGSVWRMAKTWRSPVIGSAGGGAACGPDGTGCRGYVIVRYVGAHCVLSLCKIWFGIRIANVQTADRRFRFSIVERFNMASWRELIVIPKVNRPNKPLLYDIRQMTVQLERKSRTYNPIPTAQWGFARPSSLFNSAVYTAQTIRANAQNMNV